MGYNQWCRFLATGGGSVVTVWDCSGKGPENTTPLQLQAHDESATVNVLTFQRAGAMLASGGSDGKVFLWQPNQGKRLLAESALDSSITQAAWSGDDRRLAIGTEAGMVVVYGT